MEANEPILIGISKMIVNIDHAVTRLLFRYEPIGTKLFVYTNEGNSLFLLKHKISRKNRRKNFRYRP